MLWSTLKIQIGRKINDPTAEDGDSIMDNFNDALRLFASMHTGISSVSTITGDGETTSHEVPSNMVEEKIYGVYDTEDDIWLNKVDFIPGRPIEEGYYVWPSGYINFSPAIPEDDEYEVYYVAYYNVVTDDDDNIIVPDWAYEALKLYAAGRTLEDLASKMALLGNFRTRVDSGNPEQQPILQLSKRYIEQFWDIINSRATPQYDKLNSSRTDY